MFKTILTTAAIATVGMTSMATPAEASYTGCWVSTTSQNMEMAMAGGASLSQAWAWSVQDGTAQDSGRCWTMIKGNVRRFHMIYPNLVRAIF